MITCKLGNTVCCFAACDAKNNARSVGGDAFKISLSGPALQAPVALLKDNLDG